ncbi:MAG: cupin domain-containing protein [Actinomycetota bacterium]|nr:cupin domain-containing protein [Actinomycetota bacterium]
MAGAVTSGEAGGLDSGQVADLLRARGLPAQGWGNGPGERYAWHEHDYAKILYCVAGSIVFHTRDGDLPLAAGDRLDLPANTAHAATVGPAGCRCVEAPAGVVG